MPRKRPGQRSAGAADKIKNGGLLEMPMDIPLREVIFDMGGGICARECSVPVISGSKEKLHSFD